MDQIQSMTEIKNNKDDKEIQNNKEMQKHSFS